jgi:hypothetical protein
MRKLVVCAGLGLVLAIVVGAFYFRLTWSVQSTNVPAYANLFLESFKTLLTFSFVTIGSIVLKTLIDQVLERDRNKQTELNRYEETRRTILKEFATIYSEFYSLRKLYHSARSKHNTIYDSSSNEYKTLLRDLLQKSVILEGRYGALKVLIITHFDLQRGEYQMKKLSDLLLAVQTLTKPRDLVRCQLDILGECYDDWRHAFEQNRDINANTIFYKTYDQVLLFLERGP